MPSATEFLDAPVEQKKSAADFLDAAPSAESFLDAPSKTDAALQAAGVDTQPPEASYVPGEHPIAEQIAGEVLKPTTALVNTAKDFLRPSSLLQMLRIVGGPGEVKRQVIEQLPSTITAMQTVRDAKPFSQEWWNAFVPLGAQEAMAIGGVRAGELPGAKPPIQGAPHATELQGKLLPETAPAPEVRLPGPIVTPETPVAAPEPALPSPLAPVVETAPTGAAVKAETPTAEAPTPPAEVTPQGPADLAQVAQSSKTADEFVRAVQKQSIESENTGQPDLLKSIYEWERSTPENQAKFKNAGWFHIASEYWKEKAGEGPATLEVQPIEATQSPTGIRNAIVDKQRVDRGLPERMEPLRKTNPEAWDAAMAKVDENPNAGRELVADVKATPRALKPEESALLAHETVTRENNFDNAVDSVNKATDPGDLAEAKQRLSAARDDVQELYDVGQKAGTESGQSLQARKILVNQDYSLARMEATKRAIANDGKPLSESQLAEVKTAHETITELQSKLDEFETQRSQEKQTEIYRAIVKEALQSARENAKKGRTLQDTLDSAADKARERIIARRGQLQVTIDPLNVAGLVDEAIIGASHIARGVTAFAEWSAQMIKDFGDRIHPYLKELYDRAKALHDASAEQFQKKTPQEVALARYKTNLSTRTEQLVQKIAAEDYTKPVRNKTQLDQEAVNLKAKYQRAKDVFDTQLEKDRLKNRPIAEKVLDTFAKWRRAFVLSSPVTLAKLTSAAAERMVFTPLEEAVGAGISKIIPKVAEKASREGGASIKAESKSITEGFTQGMKDAWDVLRTGKSNLDVLYGNRELMPREAVDFIGSLHGALKTIPKRNEFARSFQKRVESALASGIDVSDPLVQTRLATLAYKDANRSIFMQDNRVVQFYKRGISALEQPDKATGKTPLGPKIGATALKVLLPVVKVPTNIVAETLQYSLGTVTGGTRLANALRKGVENLSPEKADLIMRELKKGSVGAAVLVLGYLNADKLGGYYQPGQKRDPGDVKFGAAKVFGVNIPTYLVHNPLLEQLQVGATIKRVAESKLRKKDEQPQGLSEGAMAAALGVTKEVPFIREMTELSKMFDPHSRGAFTGELAKSLVVPQGIQYLANKLDQSDGETVKRDPQSIVEHIETGIPGLRKNVPEKTGR